MLERIRPRLWLGVSIGATLASHGLFVARAHPDPAAGPNHVHTQPESPEDKARRADVVASFDAAESGKREELTVGELEETFAASGGLPETDRADLKALLERTLRFELLAAEAERRGYDDDPSVVQAAKQTAVQTMIKAQVDAEVTPATVPADAVRKYYDEHIDEFVRPEMRRASMVLVRTEADAKALLDEAKAADMRGFRELARQKTQDPTSKLRGGDLRYFDAKGKGTEPGEQVDPAIAKAVFALKTIGDVSGVVRTDAGFAVVKLTGMRPAQEDKLKAAEERIRMRLWRQQRESTIDAMVDRLRKEHAPEVHPELLEAITFSSEPPTPPKAGLPGGFPHTKPPPVPTPEE